MITDKAEIKIAMLAVYYAFAVEINASDAQESILATGEINPFDCQECERELIEEGLLKMSAENGETLCVITPAGTAIYEQGKNYMNGAALERIVSAALRHFEYICTGKRYSSDIIESDGGYYVVCSLKSQKRTYMETKFFFENRSDAFDALANCKEKPEVIFSGIETLMSGKINRMF